MLATKPSKIVDRDKEIETLVTSMQEQSKNLNYALLGFRRIGKTTILQEVKRVLSEKGLIVVSLDFSLRRYDPLGFFKDLANELTTAYESVTDSKRKVLDNVRSAIANLSKLKRARLALSIAIDPSSGHPTISVSPYLKESEEKVDYSLLFRSAFDFANEISRQSKRRVVIMIDEFQYLMDWKKYSALKSIAEHLKNVIEKRGNVSYIVSGSRAHFLKGVFSSGRSPLFGLFVIMGVTNLSREHSMELYLLNDRTGTKEDAEKAYELVGGNPFYLIALATTRRKGEHLKETYKRSLTSTTGALNLYVKYILTEDIGTDAQGSVSSRVLKAAADEPMSVSQIARKAGLRMTSLPKFLSRLIDLDLIEKDGLKYKIIDPVIKDYLQMNW